MRMSHAHAPLALNMPPCGHLLLFWLSRPRGPVIAVTLSHSTTAINHGALRRNSCMHDANPMPPALQLYVLQPEEQAQHSSEGCRAQSDDRAKSRGDLD